MDNITRFIADLKASCKRNKISLSFVEKPFIKLSDNIDCAGYFSEDEALLVVATQRPDWLEILVHESCHMDQYEDYNNGKSHIWGLSQSISFVDEWLGGTDYPIKAVYKHINNSRDLEEDCERRSVVKIQQYNLPIDVKEYTQKANAYLFFYNYIKQTRYWPDSNNSVIRNEKVYKRLMKTFYKSYNKTPTRILRIFEENVKRA